MHLIKFLVMKLHQGPGFMDGIVNSIEVLVHSKTNFLKVVQHQLLFRKPLMLCANWYCKIVKWPIMRLRPLALMGPAYTQYCMNIWLPKKIYSLWIPQNLSIAQIKARVDWSKEMLQTHDRGASKHVYDIVTGNESWIYVYEPKRKQQSTVWVF